MPAQTVQVLKPHVSRDEAVSAFNSHGLRRWSWIHDFHPLRSVAELYIPFCVYRVSIRRGNTFDTRWMGLDLAFGGLDPFSFDSVPGDAEIDLISTKNHPPPVLDDAAARRILTTKIQRVLFQSGFFRMKNLGIELEPTIQQLHMPYWIGFFGAKENASIQILDATRRVMEGNKFRRFIYEWLSR